jgi:hypothetical protein
MTGIERDNPSLKGVLPKDYARPALDKQRLGQLIELISRRKQRKLSWSKWNCWVGKWPLLEVLTCCSA